MAVLLAAGATVRAADDDDTSAPAPSFETSTRAAAGVAAFAPFSQSPSIEGRHAIITGLGGYDSSKHESSFEAATEVVLWGPIALRGGAVYTHDNNTLKPSFGARVQGLREGRHGVDGALGVFYKPEGLTEAEGEIESVLSIGRHVGANYLLANLAYGQDFDGNERDGEVRLSGLRPTGRYFVVGLDSRLRFDLGSNQAKLAAHHEPTLDGVAGPMALALLGPVAVSLQAGPSVTRLQGATTWGATVMSGLATAF